MKRLLIIIVLLSVFLPANTNAMDPVTIAILAPVAIGGAKTACFNSSMDIIFFQSREQFTGECKMCQRFPAGQSNAAARIFIKDGIFHDFIHDLSNTHFSAGQEQSIRGTLLGAPAAIFAFAAVKNMLLSVKNVARFGTDTFTISAGCTFT